jgi:anti-sigma B factor antagonist
MMSDVAPSPWGAFKCRTEERSEAVVLFPAGEVDLGTAPVLWSSLKAILEDGQNVIVSLRELTYIDSTGIKVILDIHRLFLTRGQRMVLAEPAPLVQRVMDIVGLKDTIPLYQSFESALQSFHAPAGHRD